MEPLELRRKIYWQMKQWKARSHGRTALLIDGARRVGKSHVAEAFARETYDSYILIDFNKVPDEIKGLFDNYLDNLDDFFLYLSNYYETSLTPGRSAIILDEVQLYPRARSAIKYLVADGRFDYIETGSLVAIQDNVQDILVPSEEEHLAMHPLDFEEFLWAMDNDQLPKLIRRHFLDHRPLGEAMHRKVMDYFRKYLIIGGMPQAVLEYAQTKRFEDVDHVKRSILELYRSDIRKHAGRYSLKVEGIFDQIPAQLGKQGKRFRVSSLGKDARVRDYDEAFLWLDNAMLVNRCFNTTEPNIGLGLNLDKTSMKCYMADTGLLISLAFDDRGLVSEEVYKKILFDKLEFNSGMVIENVVAQMLVANGHRLFFYDSQSRDNSAERMEIDFLLAKQKATSRQNISAIEVKSGKNYTLNSLNKFRAKYRQYIGQSYVIHTGDYREEDEVIYLPLYMVPLL